MKTKYILLIIFIGAVCFQCKKYLSVKPDSSLVIPSTLADLQALLDHYSRMNTTDNWSPEVSSDNYYLNQADYSILNDYQRNMHTWKPNNHFVPAVNAWNDAYTRIYTANTVLDLLPKIERTNSNEIVWDNLKGQALFIRAKAYLESAFVWCMAYDEEKSNVEFGLPLRLDPDFNITSVRSTVKQTYNKIISDLEEATPLLVVAQPHVIRPNRHAGYGLLARAYLAMRKYEKCFEACNKAIQLKSDLFNFNEFTTTEMAASFPFSARQFNREMSYYSLSINPTNILANTKAKIDSNLYSSYATDDLRKTIFFRTVTTGIYGFKGGYTGGSTQFTGIATDEIFLMRAECLARAGDKEAALLDLNTLLIKRWKTGTFTDVTAIDAKDALSKILLERRKELLYRNLRWMDIKRLNREGYGISLTRNIAGEIFSLPANDLRFALPIPEDVIALSGMQQNPR